MKYFFSIIGTAILICCSSKFSQVSPSERIYTKEEIVALADSIMSKKIKEGNKRYKINKIVIETDSFIRVYYYPENKNIRGGDFEIKISKKDGRILEKIIYQ